MAENFKKKEKKVTSVKETAKVDVESSNKIERAQQFIFKNGKVISYISLGVIVVVALIFVINNIIKKNADESMQKAIVALDRIMPYYDAPDYKKALFGDSSKTVRGQRIIGLLEIIEEYSGTLQEKIAALYAGNSYLALNKAKEAAEYFEIALDSPSKIVLEGANAGLGASKEILGDFEEAAEYYVKSADLAISDLTKARYNYYAAKSYEKSGDKESAEKLYRDIIARNKYSEFSNYSKAGLSRLGMKID